MKRKVFPILFSLIVMSGCYTQFALVQREPPPPQISYQVDSLGDTVKIVHSADTVVKERENCYWTRNYWGQPEWRCGSPYYSQSWYQYNDYPWWYSSYPYYYDFNGRCPQYYYYDASCGSCRRYGGGDNYYSNYNRGSYNRGGGNTSTSNVSPSGVSPAARRARVTPVTNQSTSVPSSIQTPSAYQGSGVSKIEAPANSNPGPSPSAPVGPQPTQTIQSGPPPTSTPPPPSNNNGGSENNEQRHRNPRSH
jgi:hypothetical protein